MKLDDLINFVFEIVCALDKNKLLQLANVLKIFLWFFIAISVVLKLGRILHCFQTLNNRRALFGGKPLPFLLLSICSLFCIGCNWILALPKHTLIPLTTIFCFLLDAAIWMIMQGIGYVYRKMAMELGPNSNNQALDVEAILSEIKALERFCEVPQNFINLYSTFESLIYRLMSYFRTELQWIINIRILVDVLCFYCAVNILESKVSARIKFSKRFIQIVRT